MSVTSWLYSLGLFTGSWFIPALGCFPLRIRSYDCAWGSPMHVRAIMGSPTAASPIVLFHRCCWCQAGQEEPKFPHRNRMWKTCQSWECSPQKPRGEKKGCCSKGHALDSCLFFFSLRTLNFSLLSVHLLLNPLLLMVGEMILTTLSWAKG